MKALSQFEKSGWNSLLENIKLVYENNNINILDMFVTYIAQERCACHQ